MALEAFSKVAEVAKEVVKDSDKGIKDFDKRKPFNEVVSSNEKIDSNRTTKEQVNIDKRIPNEKSIEKTEIPKSNETSELSNQQKKELIDKGVSPGILDRIQLADDVYKLNTENSKLADQLHPNTDVPYKRKTVDLLGTKIEGVFPEFKWKYETVLPDTLIIAKDKSQFEHCNSQLKDAVNKNPELRKQFSERQLEQIEKGITPSGFIWHHNENRGVMQLVEADKHINSNHTGGKAIWGGGSKER